MKRTDSAPAGPVNGPSYDSAGSNEVVAGVSLVSFDVVDQVERRLGRLLHDLGALIGSAVGSGDEGGVLEELGDDQVEALLDALVAAQNGDGDLWDRLLTISIKPFMDAWTYDQDRIDQCCVHILDREGNPVSFCEYNAINRPRMNLA